MHEHAQTARAMQRSIKENLTRVEQAIETCRGHCQVDEKLVDQPPRYWAPARREPPCWVSKTAVSLNLTYRLENVDGRSADVAVC